MRICWLMLSVANATLATAQELEEVVVSGISDPRLGSLVSADSMRVATVDDVIAVVTSAADLVDTLPGASLTGQGGLFQSFSLRGFSRWRIRTEISGVPVITDRRAGNSLSFLPESFIDSIYADMGPASSLYGSGAMGGVVSVSLVDPEATSVSVGVSSTGQARDMAIKTSLNGNNTFMVDTRTANPATSANGSALNTAYRQSSLYFRHQREHGDLVLGGEVLASDGKDIGKSSAYYPDQRVSVYPHDRHTLINIRATQSDRWFAQAYLHQQDWASWTQRNDDRQTTSRYQSLTYGGLFAGTRHTESASHRLGFELSGRSNIDINETEKRSEQRPMASGLVANGREWVSGVFSERSWYFKTLTAQVGARLDHAEVSHRQDTRSKTELNGQLNLDWKPSEEDHLSFQLGTAYRLPTMSELYFSGETPRGPVRGNPTLDAEQTVGGQLSWQRYTRGRQFELSAYFNEVEHYIERILAPDGLITYQNIDSGNIWGVDGLASFEHREVSQTITWQWQRGTSKTGSALDDLPPPEIGYNAHWTGANFGLGLSFKYRLKRSDSGPGETPLNSAVMAAAQVDWSLGRHWSCELTISNGLDRTYRTSADNDAPLALGRAVRLEITWRE
ncbi:MAG: TonB-dependent receptor [Luminiphilus sp.]|nr:TonB-dependent receptor [Luminiphilus sp.]